MTDRAKSDRASARRPIHERRRQGERAILMLGTMVAFALPSLLGLHLYSALSIRVEPALSRALGVPVTLGDVEVTATGELVMRDMQLGELLSVRRLHVAADPASLLSGRPTLNGIRIVEPRIFVPRDRRVLDRLVARLRDRIPDRSTASYPLPAKRSDRGDRPTGSGLAHLSVSNGELDVELGDVGWVRLRGVHVAPNRAGLRIVPKSVQFELERQDFHVRGDFSRSAADLDLAALFSSSRSGLWSGLWSSLTRFLAVRGELMIAVDRHPPVAITEVAVRRGVARTGRDSIGDRALVVSGRTSRQALRGRVLTEWNGGAADDSIGSSEPTHRRGIGSFTARVESSEHGATANLHIDHLSLAVFAPFLPLGLDTSSAHVTGSIRAEFSPASGDSIGNRLDLGGAVELRHLRVDDRRLARTRVALSGNADFAVAIARSPTGVHLDIGRIHWRMGELAALFGGAVYYRLDNRPDSESGPTPGREMAPSWLPDRGALWLAIPAIDCGNALSSLPRVMRTELAGLDLAGPFAASAALRFDRADIDRIDLDLDIRAGGCKVLREAWRADPRTLLVHAGRKNAALARPGQPRYIALARMPRHLAGAFVASEDARFYRHRGFDVHQIERSLAVDLRDGAFVRGGSTISQQLVKNAFLTHDRNLARKLQEAVLTWRLEAHLNKQQIVEHYLNIIELGPRIFGVEAAARYWFGKRASRLSARESAFLAALAPAPRTLGGRIAQHGRIGPDMNRRVHAVLRAMRENRVLSPAAYRRARRSRIALRRSLENPAHPVVARSHAEK
ncbi:MAG: transglycosylase domain-containing protein [Proteobacteria bacterium]|nr:transglycosylase domain-containing protein [Pseudomonadota bacterium]